LTARGVERSRAQGRRRGARSRRRRGLGPSPVKQRNRLCAGVCEGVRQGAACSPGWPPGQASQRRRAPSQAPARRVNV
jgi:hypothetical protein